MKVPTIPRTDFVLRFFIDTNILIEYFEKLQTNHSREFVTKATENGNVELITSDYAIWEFLEFWRREICIQEMVDRGLSTRRAPKYPKEDDLELMEKIKNVTEQFIGVFENDLAIKIERLMDEANENFFVIMKKLILNSKLEGKDILLLTSALLKGAHRFATLDEDFKGEGNRITRLQEFLDELPLQERLSIKFVSPTPHSNFSHARYIRRIYKEWFLETNEAKQLGKVIGLFPEANVIAVECKESYKVREEDYLFIMKFSTEDIFFESFFKVEKNNLWDYETETPIQEGTKVTIKLPNEIKCDNWMNNSMVFKLDV